MTNTETSPVCKNKLGGIGCVTEKMYIYIYIYIFINPHNMMQHFTKNEFGSAAEWFARMCHVIDTGMNCVCLSD
jgi:hypothetical protein